MDTWSKIADENERAEVPADSTVRYGASAEAGYIERVLSGAVTASNGFFGGDPAPNVRKGLWLLVAASPPAPAPAPQPPAPVEPSAPSLPDIGDPEFDRKMRLLEFAQRERSIKAAIDLKTVNDQLRASNDRMSEIVGRHVTVQEKVMRDGIPSDSDLVAAVDRLTEAVKG
jgi:hypothetical protein